MSSPFYTNFGSAAAITPSDTAQQTYKAIYVGGAGNLAVEMESGDQVTFTAPPVGTLLPLRVRKVRSTGTTATLLIGLS